MLTVCTTSHLCLKYRAMRLIVCVPCNAIAGLFGTNQMNRRSGVHGEEDGEMLFFSQCFDFSDDAMSFLVQVLERGIAGFGDFMEIKGIFFRDSLELFKIPRTDGIDTFSLPARHLAQAFGVAGACVCETMSLCCPYFLFLKAWRNDNIVERPMVIIGNLHCFCAVNCVTNSCVYCDKSSLNAATGGTGPKAGDNRDLLISEFQPFSSEKLPVCFCNTTKDGGGGSKTNGRGNLGSN